jgi:hypothetical protein
MTQDEFWQIIDACAVGNRAGFVSRVHAALESRSADDLTDFDNHLRRCTRHIHTLESWAAASLPMEGCPDDSFDYFKAWVVSKGRKAFEAFCADADTLDELLTPGDDYPTAERLYYVVAEIRETRALVTPVQRSSPRPDVENLELIDDQDYLRRTLPRLWARFSRHRH